jgi:hypothetical protein
MARPRVYGQQVLVKVFTSLNDKAPLIIDFDKISIDAKVNNQSYRTIGKSVTTHQATSLDGFTINLERSKRDDYLMEFYYLLNEAHKGRLECFEILIEKTVTHTYDATAINPAIEFANLGVAQPILELGTQYLVSQANGLKNLAVTTAQSFISNNPVSNFVKDNIRGNQFLEQLKRQYENEIVKAIAIQPYQEIYTYTNCTLANFNSADEALQLSTESISFNASDVIKNGDKTAITNYFDGLMYKYYENVEKKQVDEISNAINGLLNLAIEGSQYTANYITSSMKLPNLFPTKSLINILAKGRQ